MKIDLETCCGCMACLNACPKNAISVTESANGFIIPSIDEEKCINCGLCLKVCDFNKERSTESSVLKAYSLVHKDKNVVQQSSSGGAFTAISDCVLEQGGLVAGVLFDKELSLNYVLIGTKEERDRMRGSKYIQSNVGLIFREIKEKLEQGKKVLFVGTPCQCAGLCSYLGKTYEGLLVVDFLCHGVPSNKMFKEHVEMLQKHYSGSIIDYSFRNKKYGWNSYVSVATLNDGSQKSDWINQCFLNFFSSNLSLRESCYHCPYRNAHRPSDVTIADFWDIEKLTHKKDKNGVSFVLANSEKGMSLVEGLSTKCNIVKYSEQDVDFRLQKSPIVRRKSTERFWQIYAELGYEGVVEAFFDDSWKSRIRFSVKKIAKKLKIV